MRKLLFAFCLTGALLFPHLYFIDSSTPFDTDIAFAEAPVDPLGESDSTQLDKIAAAHQKQVDKANQSPFEGMGLMAVTLIVAGIAWFWFRRNMSG